MPVRLRRRLERADGRSRAREHPRPRPRRRLAQARGLATADAATASADVPRVRVGVAAGEDRRGARRPADRHQHRDRLPLAPRAATCCRSSASTAWTRSTPSLCLAFKAHKLREAAELRAAIAAGAVLREPNGRRQQPLGPASIRKLIDCLAAILDEADRGRAHRPQPRARPADARQGAQAGADVPRDGRARRAHRRRRRAGRRRTANASHAARRPRTRPQPRSPTLWRRGMRPSDIAAELGLSKATVSYHLRRLGADGPGDLRRSARDRRDARRLRRPRQRALRHAHPRPPAARRDRRALPDPRRQDRGRHPRGAGQPGPRRRARRPPRPPPARRPPDRPGRLPVPQPARRPDEPPARRRDRRRGRARWRPTGWPRAVFPRCRTPRRTRCGGPTSRSRCSPTASTCCGS